MDLVKATGSGWVMLDRWIADAGMGADRIYIKSQPLNVESYGPHCTLVHSKAGVNLGPRILIKRHRSARTPSLIPFCEYTLEILKINTPSYPSIK